jgi:hypothetical protein
VTSPARPQVAARAVLLGAAALARQELTAGGAVRVALDMADRYPDAARLLGMHERRPDGITVAMSLSARCCTPFDVAAALQAAALGREVPR